MTINCSNPTCSRTITDMNGRDARDVNPWCSYRCRRAGRNPDAMTTIRSKVTMDTWHALEGLAEEQGLTVDQYVEMVLYYETI
jgi:hypothetical protein